MGVRAIALLLTVVLLMGTVVPASAQKVEYQNTYVNTGNQRLDILGVAKTQLGYMEGAGNASKYGSWFGLSNSAWCATFISWCAVQADISEDVLKQTCWVSADSFGVKIYYNTKTYTPQPGDLFFKNDFSHVGLVLKVEGDEFYTIEGNSDVLGSEEGLYVISNKRKLADCYFGVPAYKGEGDHNYVKGTEAEHPHKNYYECTTCGDKYYTGSTAYDTDCGKCLTCNCTTDAAGYYICTLTDTVLNVRSGHGVGYNKIGGVHPGEVVYVYATNGSWAHIGYDGIYGYVALEYLEPYTPPEPEPTEPETTAPAVTEPEQTPDQTEPTHQHAYGDGHYHECAVCGERYVADGDACPLCGTTENGDEAFPWWIVCILEGLIICFLLVCLKLRHGKKKKAKYLH